MADAVRRNGYPEAEVIVGFADGLSYSKAKLDDALRVALEHPRPKVKAATSFKKEDVEMLMSEFDMPRAAAEKALAEHNGDVQKAVHALVFS